MSEKVELSPRDFGILVGYAIRYSLGRATYAPWEVCQIAAPHVAAIPGAERRNIIRDIAEAEERGELGMECDAREWRMLKALLEENE